MRLGILTLLSGLLISAVAIYYSVAGLASIFSAAVIPIIVMGTSLELAKLVATVWLKQHWQDAPRFLKLYLIAAVMVLMLITSMGIFGYLSRAHSDQALASGDVEAKISVYDQKIQTAKEDIDADRTALKQLDAGVDQVMGRSSDSQGAQRAISIRRSQRDERTRLTNEIEAKQAIISKITDESAPIRASARKVEADVGPIKYIAALIYGDNPGQDVLEKSVRWVIILLVIVFDPLAVSLLLASQYSFEFERQKKLETSQIEPEVEEISEEAVDTVVEDPLEEIVVEVAEEPKVVNQTPLEHQLELELHEDFDLVHQMDVFPEPTLEPTLKITHTADSMIIEDSAGTQTISTKLATYVQNEEQRESSQWSNIAKTITEDRYLKASKENSHE